VGCKALPVPSMILSRPLARAGLRMRTLGGDSVFRHPAVDMSPLRFRFAVRIRPDCLTGRVFVADNHVPRLAGPYNENACRK
jgi:hypothetical protein